MRFKKSAGATSEEVHLKWFKMPSLRVQALVVCCSIFTCCCCFCCCCFCCGKCKGPEEEDFVYIDPEDLEAEIREEEGMCLRHSQCLGAVLSNHLVRSHAGMCQTERRNGGVFFAHRQGSSQIAPFCSLMLSYMSHISSPG